MHSHDSDTNKVSKNASKAQLTQVALCVQSFVALRCVLRKSWD